jgi:uncharacterized membrane protein YfcA
MLIGIQLSKKIDGAKLKPIFGWSVLVMACTSLQRKFSLIKS